MKVGTILQLVGLIVSVLYGGVQTYLAIEARAETVEVAGVLADACQRSYNSQR